ncbi:UNVERIFIED_CONTAM: hypothetical protein Q9R71_17385 [Actinomycetes bacterium ARC8]|nr:hypothetical protein [Actinomycetes bacterium ARC8]
MSRSAKRILGNVSVLVVLVALVAVLVVSATSPTLLKNDAKLTAEANAGTPIVQAPSTPKPAPEVAGYTSSTPKTMSERSQEWADEKINQYLNGNGAHSFNAFPGSVHGDTLRWSSPVEGELVITVKNGWLAEDLDAYANLFLLTVGHESPELSKVTVQTEDGTISESETDKTPWE